MGVMKSKFLTDFLIKLQAKREQLTWWSLSIDRSSNKRGNGIRIILEGPNDLILEQATRFNFSASTNQVECEALIVGVQLAHELEVKKLRCYNDSQLFIGQVKGSYQSKYPSLHKYFHMVKNLSKQFDEFEINHVQGEENNSTNVLSKLASTNKPNHHTTLI